MKSLRETKRLKVEELKAVLKYHGQPVTGKKDDLVLRCHALFERQNSSNNSWSVPQENTLIAPPSNKKSASGDVTCESLAAQAIDCVWVTDLRGLPPFNFVQLYDYLVLKTAKYDHASIRTSGYKKLKAFQFFKEGHIKTMHVGSIGGVTYLKAEVLASMKQYKYKVIISFSHLGDVLKAACQCPAGRGVDGLGHCNHVGGVLFAVEDFCHRGFKDHAEPVSCTSRLCNWNVPRNMRVDPKPVDEIHVTKYRFGKETDQVAKSSMYDPRATEDREINPQALETLSSKLSTCLQSSSYFLFYGLSPQPAVEANVEEGNVEIESLCEAIPENAPDIVIEKDTDSPALPFNDQYDVSSPHFIDMMECYVETVTDKEIDRIERITRGQSSNDAWRELKRVKLTASNFYAAAVRQREPDKLLKNIMYLPKARKPIPALEYGQLHEKDAVASYVASKTGEGNTNLRVYEVRTIISKERPGYGASLDRKVYDPMARGMKTGGLKVKCPYSKRGLSLEEACKDKHFCLSINDEGIASLKFGHHYFYQVQGQMFVCKIEWVDFVVWFGEKNVFIERVYFNKAWWYQEVLPKLDFFYKRAFLPEVFTRRIARGVKLYNNSVWKSFKQARNA